MRFGLYAKIARPVANQLAARECAAFISPATFGLPPMGGRMLALDAGAIGVLGWEREVPVIARWNEPSPG